MSATNTARSPRRRVFVPDADMQDEVKRLANKGHMLADRKLVELSREGWRGTYQELFLDGFGRSADSVRRDVVRLAKAGRITKTWMRGEFGVFVLSVPG